MRRLRIFLLILGILVITVSSGCHATYYKVPVTKSRKHFRPYKHKGDKGKDRVKIRKYKSLKHTRNIHDK